MMGIDFGTILGVGFIQGIILFWYKRHHSRVDHLEIEVKDLRDDKVKDLLVRADAATKSRAEMHKDISNIRATFVHKKECEKMHDRMERKLDEFTAASRDLARVEEKVEQATVRIEKTGEQLISIGRDLSELEGRLKR